jgi:hypothetical protein
LYPFILRMSTNSETLNQGIKFKKYQQRIMYPKKNPKKNEFIGLEGFDSQIVKQTKQLIDMDPSKHQNEYQELQSLQTQFSSLLSQYLSSETNIISTASNYVNSTNTSLGKNIYVSNIVNNPVSEYLGIFNDSASNPAMTPVKDQNGNVIPMNYTECQQEAIQQSNLYFGLENLGSSGAQCSISNDLSLSEQYGTVVPSCSTGSDGYIYATSGTNAIYENTPNGPNYVGCYIDSSTNPAMTMSGPNLSGPNFAPVYVAGTVGIGPWGGGGVFPDSTAQWIWYTADSQNNAPTISMPITLIYEYNYTGTNYTTVNLNVACDNESTIYLNANEIGAANGGWGGAGYVIPITLAPGANYISAAVINQGGPAGFLLTCMDSTGSVLFNTNGSWMYTEIPAASLVPTGQNFSVATCQQYAQTAGYQYFGLQDGTNGSSLCYLSNNLNTATQYGEKVDSTVIDGNTYGGQNINAIYQVLTPGYPNNLGNVGYINDDGTLSQYPSSMINGNSVINQNSTCPSTTINVDSIEWQNYQMSTDMTGETRCGLAAELESDEVAAMSVEKQLVQVTSKIMDKINYLESLDSNVIEQLGINREYLDKISEEYSTVYENITQYKKTQKGIKNVVSDSEIVVTQQNYSYYLWVVLAIVLLIAAIVLIKISLSS